MTVQVALDVFDHQSHLDDFLEDANLFLSVYPYNAHGYANWIARIWSPLCALSEQNEVPNSQAATSARRDWLLPVMLATMA